jgi:hypothetical protein
MAGISNRPARMRSVQNNSPKSTLTTHPRNVWGVVKVSMLRD